MTSRNIYSFSGICDLLGKEPLCITNLQRSLGIKSDATGDYPEAYLRFLQKVIALRTCGISLEAIGELFETEKTILTLLHVDSLNKSETWYLSEGKDASDGLLLTGYNTGLSMDSSGIQHTLDFGAKEVELFKGAEMGVDVRKILGTYIRLRDGILERAHKALPSVEHSVVLAKKMVGRIGKGMEKDPSVASPVTLPSPIAPTPFPL